MHLTPSKAAFMIRYTSGYLCAPMSSTRAKLLDLPPMVPMRENSDPNRTAYCVTVDALGGAVAELRLQGREETSTGISANDRSVTCAVLGSKDAQASHVRRPGHVVPLTARDGGVRVRTGHTEAGWEFARLAGIEPAVAVIGEMVVDGQEVVTSEGTRSPEFRESGMMRMKECLKFGRMYGIKCCTIEALAAFVRENEGEYDGEISK
jgi:3,4-dihydroxy 2-butanone 4-phosphate synthase